MKAKAFLLVVIAALIMSACAKTSEDKVTKAFKEYVKTDFGNPDDFMEITKIEQADTFGYALMKDYLDKADSVGYMLTVKQKLTLLSLRDEIAKDTTYQLIQTELKVRMKDKDGVPQVNSLYVVDDNGKIHVQDHPIKLEETPSPMKEVFEFMKEVVVRMKKFNEKVFGSY